MVLPNRTSFAAMKMSMDIFAKYCSEGLDTQYQFGGDHDIIYCYVDVNKVSEEDGEILEQLGWHVTDADTFGMWT